MERINNWEEIEEKGTSDFIRLSAGGYIGIIKSAEEHTSESGNKSLKIECDIAEGNFKDYFQKSYDNNPNADKKWDNNSTRYLGLGESSLPFLKGFITSVEKSNTGYTWNWDEKSLVGKKVGIVYQYEEYEKQDGSTAIKTKLNQFRSLDKLDEVNKNERITKNVKLLNGNYIPIDNYNGNQSQASQENSELRIADDELPF
ncbi:hypothetical protein [uncultured Rikenella sp.]|uniref:hypothetical protein n=1 Tax=uncultured Rikenella sp. TaxID=368003 RepID=UPI0026185730|nr:hypothetical protein [uncultured Rikenella sp.]